VPNDSVLSRLAMKQKYTNVCSGPRPARRAPTANPPLQVHHIPSLVHAFDQRFGAIGMGVR
jgi:hypothetical protein